LLRVLETGEFLRVGSSKVLKTNVRVIAATNVDLKVLIQQGKFREDLYYRLATVPIHIPPLRERKEDIPLLFRHFALEFAERHRMPPISLTDEAMQILVEYRWPGNIRQLKNVTEQISIIEQARLIDAETLKKYLPDYFETRLPVLYDVVDSKTYTTEREILYKILFDLKNDVNDLKRLVLEIIQKGGGGVYFDENSMQLIRKIYNGNDIALNPGAIPSPINIKYKEADIQDTEEIIEENLSIQEKEKELIKKALEKHKGKRKQAAIELGISERTLYRKIKEYNLNV